MMTYGLPLLCAVFTWWFATGVVLYVDGLPRRTFVVSLGLATALALLAGAALVLLRDQEGAAAAYLGFFAGIAIWGWHELMFLTGRLTGPRREPLPSGATGWPRFLFAVETVIWHELAILATAGLMALLSLGAANQMALWTFLLLWGMRVSAKLNVFLGVSNLAEAFLPNHLEYLKSYFRKAPMNLFFPVSITAGTGVTIWLGLLALAPGATAFEAAAFALLAALAALAVIEHWMLVLPLSETALWRWALASHQARKAASADRGRATSPESAAVPSDAPATRRRSRSTSFGRATPFVIDTGAPSVFASAPRRPASKPAD